ncbi:glycosyltransferase [Gallibacterium anatis]|uniref:Glycosyltransferase n=1 Tax=Gallibacterium anatis TaxID=750 RepID=A0AAX3XDJ0_9PAST|nr:glycosyltransferase [Gallibacterium anatis]MDK9430456.1 glycosyltransferase [Gallibacterium anatis]WIM80228.1 glycosyltransferase [Gallibacterium anatis]
MKFSVLMSLYYKEKAEYLTQCFASLAAQTMPADEIVLVFDGQIPQQLQDCVDEWQRKLPLKIVPLPQNVGLGKALNAGLAECSNEWVFRMDTDDLCVQDRFAKQIAYIEAHPEVSMVGGQIEEFDDANPGITSIRRVPVEDADIKKMAPVRSPFNHMALAYKKSAIQAVGGYQHHLFLEDYNLWLRFLSAGYIAHNLPDILIKMRAGQNMYNRRRGMQYFKSEWKLAKLKIKLGVQNPIGALAVFFVRAFTRILPGKLLGKVYKLLRKI